MTNWLNNFENGTNGTAISTANSGGTNNTPFSGVWSATAGTAIYDSTVAHTGTLSMLAGGVNTNGGGVFWGNGGSGPGAYSNFWVRFYVYLTSYPPNQTNLYYAGIDNTSTGQKMGIALTPTGNLVNRDINAHVNRGATSTTVLPLNQWVRIEYNAIASTNTNGTNGLIYIFTGGNLEGSTPNESINSGGWTGSVDTLNTHQFGPNYLGANFSWQANYDDIGVSNVAALGSTQTPVVTSGESWGMLAVTGGTPPAPAGTVLFNGNFSTGDLSQWSLVLPNGTSGITVYTASSQPSWPAPPHGTYAARFNTTDGVPANSTGARVQLDGPVILNEGSDVYIGLSCYIPSSLPSNVGLGGNFFAFTETMGDPNHGSPEAGAWDIRQDSGNPQQRICVAHGSDNGYGESYAHPIIFDQWFDVVRHIKFSKNSSVGFTEVWLNGVQQTLTNGQTRKYLETMASTESGIYPVLQQYRAYGSIAGSFAIYLANYKVATTYAAAAPA